MKKILIISYCFPPCNLTSSQRVFSWAKYLSECGWHPIIVCRRWEKEIAINVDQYISTKSQTIEHEVNENYEIYWLPYKSNLRDHFLISQKYAWVRKLLSFLFLLLEKPFRFFDSLGNYEKFVAQYIKDNPIDGIYITANPFVLFRIGYIINRKFNLKWAADYRDSWSSSEMSYSNDIIGKLIRMYDSYFEKKWLKSTSFITAISQQYAEQIGKYLNKPAKPIYNGYFEEDFLNGNGVYIYDKFTVTYVGSLYQGQKIEIFLEAVKRLIDNKGQTIKFQMCFPGLTYFIEQEKRVLKFVKGYEQYFNISGRLPRKEVMKIQRNSHLLLHVGWPDQSGVVGSKVYEYMAVGRPILICPNDNGVLENKVLETKTGYVVNSENEAYQILLFLYEKFEKNETHDLIPDQKKIAFYSRKNQTGALAELFNNYFKR